MEILERPGKGPAVCLVFLLGAAAAGCSERDGILGLNDGIDLALTVTTVTPADWAEDVALNIISVSAAFSVPVAPMTAGASFTLTCAAPCTAPAGMVALDSTGRAAVFTLTPGTALESLTLYTATLAGFYSLAADVPMTAPFVWSFTTGLIADTTAPLVSSTTPQSDDTGVAFNTLIAVSFSEPMDHLSISTDNFGLDCPAGLPVAGTVTYTMLGNVATFVPTGELPADADCTVTIGTGVEDAAGNAMAEAFSWNFTTGSTPDLTAPLVETTNPPRDAIGVNPNTTLMAAFNEPMDPLTFLADQFTLDCPVGTSITGLTLYVVGGSTVIFGPDAVMPVGTVCRARIDASVTDLAGNPMVSTHSWTFTTGTLPDTLPPIVSSTSPAPGDVGVAINSLIAAGFSEFMDPSTITTATFELACPAGTAVVGTVNYVDGGLATFTPAGALPGGTTCTAGFATGVRDVAGNALSAPFEWTFTTSTAPDTTAPLVSSTTPLSNDIGIAINTLVTASFNEPIDPQTISTSSFALNCPGGTPVTASVDYSVSGNIATLTPAADLPAGTTCSATITAAVEDVAHNPLATAHTWNFATGAAPDVTAPLVSSTSPSANATGIAFNSLVTASFSEPMAPSTITTATFTLSCPSGASVAGTVGYSVIGHVATWTPTANLPPNTTCTATIGSAVEDDAGNPLATVFNWSFTTGAAPDTTAPTVVSTNPLAGDAGVATSSYVMAEFSEPMDSLSITPASFTLACPAGTPIASTVGYAVNSINPMLMPTSDLPESTLCTATLTTAVADVAGNALAAAYAWSFTTGLAPDTTAPSVDSTNPADNAVGVCINKTINATFTEAMDPFTVTTASFMLDAAPSGPVAGVVTYDAQSNIATFEPSANLTGTPATEYIVTIVGGPAGVLDMAGNMLPQDIVTTFTTNASTCPAAPALGAASPFGGFGGNASLTNDGLDTLINGDIGVNAGSPTITGLQDTGGNSYTVTLNNDGLVNGRVHTLTAPPGSIPGDVVTRARADALAAFNSLSPANLPGGINMADPAQCPSCGGLGDGAGELAGRTLPPGVYLSAAGTFDLAGPGKPPGNLTLDAGGDANAVWVFQTTALTGTLNVGLTGPAPPAVPIQVLLINGAKPGNVFWYVPAGAVIGTGSTLAGTVLSNAAITISTTGGAPPSAPETIINGRVISLVAGVTMTNAVITVPPP